MSRVGVVGLVVLVAVVSALGATAAADDRLDELNQRRDEIERQRADVGASAGVLALDVDDALAELDRLEGEADTARLDALAARVDADLAASDASRLSAAADLASGELGHLKSSAATVAIERYIGQPDQRALDAVLRGNTFAPATIDAVLISVVGDRTEYAADVRSAEIQLDRRLDDASGATTLAQRASEEATRLAALAELTSDEYLVFVGELQERLDQLLMEADALESLDADLAEQIRARETVLARRLPPRPPYLIADPGPTVGIEETTVVRGLRVNLAIAAQVDAMFAAAELDGIALGGGGWRDGAQQIVLRQAHCGPTEYDIYQKPAGQCSPPTARPTRSMHERGLALDLTSDGALIGDRLNPGYQWLLVHAESFGFFNLPSEPWHWSTNGR